ncbi:hypothetical protein OIY81_141 [Cryptosporidium canis]|uniref:Signal peptide-containing protein n=1 Tax=Cryptosporidium canis TaxID=195482 RepID=A0ABQ8P4R6_9CRYT|nr:hypothetical protein OJ252_2929 [Cryptosporidium canis]KAJ1615224.1 hypothetical protein OIY81_141 [Cryptosporidium canis]
MRLIILYLLFNTLAIPITNGEITVSGVNVAQMINKTDGVGSNNSTKAGAEILFAKITSLESTQINNDEVNKTTDSNTYSKHSDTEPDVSTTTNGINATDLENEYAGLSLILEGNEPPSSELENKNSLNTEPHGNYLVEKNNEPLTDGEEHILYSDQPVILLMSDNTVDKGNLVNSEQLSPERKSRLFINRKMKDYPNIYPYVTPFAPIKNKVTDYNKEEGVQDPQTMEVDHALVSKRQSNEHGMGSAYMEIREIRRYSNQQNSIASPFMNRPELVDSQVVSVQTRTEVLTIFSTSTNGTNGPNEAEEN